MNFAAPQILGTTTHLVGALLGKEIKINSSAWTGYSGGRSDCVIDAFVGDFDWPSGRAPALIVRTVANNIIYFQLVYPYPGFGLRGFYLVCYNGASGR
jgi:hypothetical protein